MDNKEERVKTLVNLVYVLAVNELGLNSKSLTDEEITLLLLKNKITIDEMALLDELVQDVVKEVSQNDR